MSAKSKPCEVLRSIVDDTENLVNTDIHEHSFNFFPSISPQLRQPPKTKIPTTSTAILLLVFRAAANTDGTTLRHDLSAFTLGRCDYGGASVQLFQTTDYSNLGDVYSLPDPSNSSYRERSSGNSLLHHFQRPPYASTADDGEATKQQRACKST